MNDIELQVVEGTGFMALGELEYARHNKRLFEAAKAKPDMLVTMVEVWLNEWVRMADEMIEQCAALHILGSKGEAIFEQQDQIASETAAFKARMQEMRDEGIMDAAKKLRCLVQKKE